MLIINDKTKREKAMACIDFFRKLSDILSEDYEIVKSGSDEYIIELNRDDKFRVSDHYLVPFGTESQITYYGKPEWSFRISDHWNWKSSLKKCDKDWYIQCYSVDMPNVKNRLGQYKSSPQVKGIQVAIFGKDKRYHCVYGECFNRNKKIWNWMETDPEEIAKQYDLI